MKRSILLISSLLAISTLSSCETTSKEYIGIVSAMSNEIDILLKEAQIERIDKIGGVDYHVGKLKDKNVIISKSGIGKVKASAGVTTLFNSYNISDVLFTGIAGAVGDETSVLDQVIATTLVEHDYGRLTDEGLIWAGGDPGGELEPGVVYTCDENLVNLAYEVAVSTLGEKHVFKGRIATGDQFIASENYVKKLRENFNAIACEMEGASVACICEAYKTPYVVLRALSDKADGKAHESYADFGNIAASHSSNIVLGMLEKM